MHFKLKSVMRKFLPILPAIIVLTGMILPGCEDHPKNNHEILDDGTGKLVINITDEPFPLDMIESATVTVVKVDIRDADLALTDTVNPFVVLMEDTVLTYNLVELRNGVTAKMIEADIPSGDYDLIRLYITEASLAVKEGGNYIMKIPSGSQTGVKVFIKPSIPVSGKTITELLLDFSLEQSFVLKGNDKTAAGIKGFNFKPVIRAVNNTTAGMIAGMVADILNGPIENASVWIEQDTLVTSALTDATGYYGMIGVPAGMYDIYATAENYDTVCITGIKVLAGNLFEQNFILTPVE